MIVLLLLNISENHHEITYKPKLFHIANVGFVMFIV